MQIGRNDACFCGSGKKYKKCHGDIHPDSYAANIYSLYNKIDKMIDEHYNTTDYKPACHQGCDECCHNTFSVGQIEFNIIQYELRKWDKSKLQIIIDKAERYWEEILRKHPKEAKVMLSDMQGQEVNRDILHNLLANTDIKGIPCVFLDEDKHECMIYKYRPSICRTYGQSYKDIDPNMNLCSKMKQEEVKKNGCDITRLTDEMRSVFIIDLGNDYAMNFRMYPLVYSLYQAFFGHKKELHIFSYQAKFEVPFSIYKDALKENMKRSK